MVDSSHTGLVRSANWYRRRVPEPYEEASGAVLGLSADSRVRIVMGSSSSKTMQHGLYRTGSPVGGSPRTSNVQMPSACGSSVGSPSRPSLRKADQAYQ